MGIFSKKTNHKTISESQFLPSLSPYLKDLRSETTDNQAVIIASKVIHTLANSSRSHSALLYQSNKNFDSIVSYIADSISSQVAPRLLLLRHVVCIDGERLAFITPTTFNAVVESTAREVKKSHLSYLFCISGFNELLESEGGRKVLFLENILRPLMSTGSVQLACEIPVAHYTKFSDHNVLVRSQLYPIVTDSLDCQKTYELLQRLKENFELYYNKKVENPYANLATARYSGLAPQHCNEIIELARKKWQQSVVYN